MKKGFRERKGGNGKVSSSREMGKLERGVLPSFFADKLGLTLFFLPFFLIYEVQDITQFFH